MPITTVNSNQLISVAKYNEIQTSSTSVLSYYGVNATSVQIADANAIIYADNHWTKLYDDINKCTIHQTGSVIPGATPPTNATVASVVLTNQIIDAANLAVTNKANVASGQTVSITTSSSRTSNFGTNVTIRHTAAYEWFDANSMTYFLQSGGRLEADLNWVNSGLEIDSDLIDVLNTADIAIQTNTYKVSNSNQTPSPYTFSKGAHTITITFDRTSTKKYTLDIAILSTLLQTLNGSSITGSTRYVASTDVGTLAGGILGPVPQTTITVTFQGSAGTPTATRALTASPATLSYTFYTGATQSTAQTITLTNNGNTAVNITGINYTNAGAVTALPTYSWNVSNPGIFANTTINPGASRTISLAYSGATAGTFNNSVTIINDGNQPSLIVSTSQVISGFSLNPIPASLTPTVVSLNGYSQQFVILNSNVSPVLSSSYTASLSGAGASNFSIINSSAGPTLVFDPSGKLNNTYVVTISISLNNNPSFVVSSTVTLTLDVPTQNIGTWISATGKDNAVIGMSYDIIGGTKYLTVGVGAGNDGANIVKDGGIVSAANLGINNTTRLDSDPNPSKGVPLYDYVGGTQEPWIDFLKGNTETSGVGYGVSYRYQKTMPVTPDYIVRSYTFNANSVAHTYEYSVDDLGFVEISNPNTGGYDILFDGRNRSGYSNPNWRSINSGTWTPQSAGIYTIRFNSRNSGFPGALAFRLTNNITSQIVWSTRVPVRTAYLYWAEVYRVPLTQGAHTYSSLSYIVKDSAISIYEGYPYGRFFEGQSMFSVTDDGVGNLTVTINPIGGSWPVNSSDQLTVSSIRDLAYYFSDYNRITNLTNPSTLAATQTLRFDGFQANGSVRTTIVDKPASDPLQIITTGGGGCPDPRVLITLADRTTKPAGEIQVGDLLYTMHETTKEFGIFAVTDMTIITQPMMNIMFTDGTTLRVSKTHKFLMANGNWKQVFELFESGQGSVIKGLEIDKTIQTIEHVGEGPAVKLTVEDAHTYISDGLVSHNIKVVDNVSNSTLEA